jgi:hypothetical protein
MRSTIAMIGLLMYAASTGAEETSLKETLARLPSAEGKHVQAIRDLKPGEWLELGMAAADPKYGRAYGRSWWGGLAFAPELKSAFVQGEGVHGYARPDGRYMDDLWLYDLNAHRWICLYPGADTKTLKLSLDSDGFEVDEHGQRTPVAMQAHAYQMNTYDPAHKSLLSMPCGHDYWTKELPQRTAWLKKPPANATPWMFSLRDARWDREKTESPAPHSSYGDTLIYVGNDRCFFAHGSQEVWFYDTKGLSWAKAKPDGPSPPWGIDPTSCFDTKRNRIYLGGGGYPVVEEGKNALWAYDLQENRWIDPAPKGRPCRGSNSYATNNAFMVYESKADRVLLVVHSHNYAEPNTMGIYIYDPKANSWADEPLKFPDAWPVRKQKSGFYCEELGAIIVLAGGDSVDDVTVWAYRPA